MCFFFLSHRRSSGRGVDEVRLATDRRHGCTSTPRNPWRLEREKERKVKMEGWRQQVEYAKTRFKVANEGFCGYFAGGLVVVVSVFSVIFR